jgi:hypothetical protein
MLRRRRPQLPNNGIARLFQPTDRVEGRVGDAGKGARLQLRVGVIRRRHFNHLEEPPEFGVKIDQIIFHSQRYRIQLASASHFYKEMLFSSAAETVCSQHFGTGMLGSSRHFLHACKAAMHNRRSRALHFPEAAPKNSAFSVPY